MRLFKWIRRGLLVFVIGAIIPAIMMVISCRGDRLPQQTASAPGIDREMRAKLQQVAGYSRKEERTYLSFPEWYIVYVSQDYGAFLKDNRPSAFPYLTAVTDFWNCYCGVTRLTSARYDMNWGAHLTIYVIGISHSAEYLLKGLYENTLGRLFEFLSFGRVTQEERFAQKVASDYGTFLNTVPWYEYPFADKLRDLWSNTSYGGEVILRKWERKLVLSAEYGFKALYGGLIKMATGSVLDAAPLKIDLVVGQIPSEGLFAVDGVEVIARLKNGISLIRVPRYAPFTERMIKFSNAQIPVLEIAGNSRILITSLMPPDTKLNSANVKQVFSMKLATKKGWHRNGYSLSVRNLGSVIRQIGVARGRFEHAYDY